MTVFIAHAPADRQIAEGLEKVIERRGQFAELDDGQTALRPMQASDVLVLLVSQALTFATARLRLEQRALDAWADGRLVVVKLDSGFPPVGLRDLPSIDAGFEAQREFKWLEVADAVRDKLRAPSRDGAAPREHGSSEARGGETRPGHAPGGRKPSASAWILLPILALPGVFAIVATASIWLANRIGPTPGDLADLRHGIEDFGLENGSSPGATEWLFLVFGGLTLLIIGFFLAHIVRRLTGRAPKAGAPQSRTEPAPAPKPSDAVFVSYARANQGIVLPVIEAVKQQGRRFWLDQQGIAAGDGWAGEIVRAIRSAPRVIVMCSKAAFESDHVKREIYLADRYQKQLVPVFIEQAEPPEDFEYFFAGVQMLNLFETPEAERPEALMRALGTT